MTPLTIDDLLAGYDNPDWLGFGYLGERRSALSSTDEECPPQPERVAEADVLVLEVANDRGWTVDVLFAWCNSRPGRHFGDYLFGGSEGNDLQRGIRELLRTIRLAEFMP